jgi:hypothetical protein
MEGDRRSSEREINIFIDFYCNCYKQRAISENWGWGRVTLQTSQKIQKYISRAFGPISIFISIEIETYERMA